MHDPIEITKDLYWIGVNDYETDLFEAQWPIPEGVSYNSYLITGKKTALIDTVKKTHLTQFVEKIRALLTGGRTLDYLVINHMEPDHSGAIPILRQLFPEMSIVGNKKTIDMVGSFYGITTGTTTIADSDELDLGGHVLTFALTPMVHWPETMMTYDKPRGCSSREMRSARSNPWTAASSTTSSTSAGTKARCSGTFPTSSASTAPWC